MAKEEKKEDEKLTPVGDGIEPSEVEEKPDGETEAKGDDEKIGHGADEEEADEEETVDDERARIRERRKREKQKRSARIASDRRELEYLRKRNENVERQLSQFALRQDKIEESTDAQRIGQLESQIREAETIHGEAVTAKDGTLATEALRVRDALRDTLRSIKGGREARAKEKEESTTQERESRGPDPDAVENGRNWLRDNSEWFDPELKDEDSFLVRALEERMAREGRFDPREPEYWEELNRRIDKRLPGLRKKSVKSDDVDWEEDDEKPQPKPEAKKSRGPRISVGGKTRSLKPGEVFITAERKKALMQAGVWDDEEKRERYLQSYKRWDEEALQNKA